MITQYEATDRVLEDTWECTATVFTHGREWCCISPIHGDEQHYFVKVV